MHTAAAGEKLSEKTIGESIGYESNSINITIPEAENFESISGMGIKAVVNGKQIIIGNEKIINEYKIKDDFISQITTFANQGKTAVICAVDGKAAGIIAISDQIKETSRSAVSKLENKGINTVMLTGDNKQTALTIAGYAGIKNVIYEVLPEDKAAEIKKIQESGKITAMVGDGINDAPALAQSDVGIAIGSGTDIAIESADIVLMNGSLEGVNTAIKLSHATIRNIKQNLFWAFGYNVLGIPIAMGLLHIFGGPLLNPMIAAAAMSLSSVSVLSNALRLRNFKADA